MSMNVFKWMMLFSVILNVDAYVNIEEQFYKRSQRYPTNEYQKILVFSPYRTGSTLVFNVLKFLFEDSDFLNKNSWVNNTGIVGKTHTIGYIDPSDSVFCTIRNPIDTCFSLYRVMMSNRSCREMNEEILDAAVHDYVIQMQCMHQIFQKKMPNVILLRYEDFACNLEFIFNKIEKIFNFKICEMDRLLMQEMLSKENVISYVKYLKDFSNYDEATLLHGAHIEDGEFSEEEKAFIYEEIRKKLSDKCNFLKEYGYAL